MRVYLVRHGLTDYNAERRAQGHKEVELNEIGLEQAECLADRFSPACIVRIYCSDLIRCKQTCAPTAKELEIEPEYLASIRERRFGCLDGQHYTVLRAWFEGEAREKGIPRHEARPPNGESFVDVWDRLEPFTNRIKEANEDVIVFSHGGACSLMLCQLLSLPIEASSSFRFDNAAITEVRRRGDGVSQLIRYNDSLHMEE
jgi:broad specificity phosphatase PhoE